MRRWNATEHRYVEQQDVDEFLEKLIELCRTHGLSISHEDKHGAFIVKDLNQHDIDWIRDAISEVKNRSTT